MNRNRLSSNEVVMCYNTDEVDKLCTFLNLEKEYYIKQIQNKEWVGIDKLGEIYHAGCPRTDGKHLIRFRDIEPLLLDNKEAVNHPSHYGGEDNPYEVIKVIRAWGLGFELGNTAKYIARAGKKDPNKEIEDLEKGIKYLQMRVNYLKDKL